MDLSQVLTVGLELLSPVCLIAGAVYLRGQKDEDLSGLKTSMAELKASINGRVVGDLAQAREQGAQSVRNDQLSELLKEVKGLRDELVKFAQQVVDHERDCARRQIAQEGRFTSIDRNVEHLAAAIRNVALGYSNTTNELPATRKKEP